MDDDAELQAIRARLARDLAAPAAAGPPATARPVEAHEADLERLLGTGVVLLDCWATWCPPCRIMEPVIDQLAAEWAGKAVVAKLDVDRNPRASEAFQVRSIPTFFLFKDGKAIERFVGAVPKAQLENALRRATAPVRSPGPRR